MHSNQEDISSILSKHNLRNTEKRRIVLDLFLSHDHALSSKMIEEKFNDQIDRVTLYRLLNSFEENGIIHKVINQNNESFYAKCSACNHSHKDDHMHFHCSECEKIYCLEDISIENIQIPDGFKTKSLTLDVYGVCKNCC